MQKSIYQVIGLMSGTSLDGLDIAFCQIQKLRNQWNAQIIEAQTVSYPEKLRQKLAHLEYKSAQVYVQTDIELGKFFGEQTQKFIVKNNLNLDFIASHGHTIFHQPEYRVYGQIGYGAEIAAQTKLPVICDFRGLDIALGGQGAPLVPIGDKLLFSDYDFCLNLGGIANISFDYQENRIAFDICIANMALNYLAQKKEKRYDENGDLARQGNFNPDLFEKLNQDNFYNTNPPKSLGKEWFIEKIEPILAQFPIKIEDKLYTFCKHIAYQIGQVIRKYPSQSLPSKLLITGGGAWNSFLVEQIQSEIETREIKIYISDNQLVDYKEALVFAFLGVLRYRQEINCLTAVTGTSYDHSGGVIYHPKF